MATRRPADPGVSFAEALRVWVKVALLSFGGPTAQIAVMHRIVVEEKRWVSEERFLHALNFCMLLPGPEAQQLATYLGWLLHGWRGGLAAGALFVVPGFLTMLALSVAYAGFRGLTLVDALLFGLKPAVMAIVAHALLRIGGRALRNGTMVLVAGASFVAVFFLEVPFPMLVLAAAGVGLLGGRFLPARFLVAGSHGAAARDPRDSPLEVRAAGPPPPFRRSLRVAGIWLFLWLAPLGALAAFLGTGHVLVQEGAFFSKVAVVTFGGAYAVLAYVAQQAVEVFGWVEPGEMLDGLGMAETTPGPLILVVEFVGFLGAYRDPGSLPPILAGTLGAIVTTWATFVPSFLWIFLGAPYVESLRGKRSLAAALSAITAAVVGVILNLALWFSLHTLFGRIDEVRRLGVRLLVPDVGTLEVASAALTLAAFLAMFRFRVGMIPTLAGSVVLGAVWRLVIRG